MRKVKISAVQFDVSPVKNFSEFEGKVIKAIELAKGADFVVFPEWLTFQLITTFLGYKEFALKDIARITTFTDQYVELFRRLAKEKDQYIVAGSHLRKEGIHIYNTCHLFGPDGTLFEHRKTHIGAFEREWNTFEGNVIEVLELDKAKVGIAICYEIEFPECIRMLALKGAEVIFCPSFPPATEDAFWRVRYCCQARCIENQIYVVNCPPVGHLEMPGFALWSGAKSSILSPCDSPWPANGIIAQGEGGKGMVVTGEIDLDEIYVRREKSLASTFKDRARRRDLYEWLYLRPR